MPITPLIGMTVVRYAQAGSWARQIALHCPSLVPIEGSRNIQNDLVTLILKKESKQMMTSSSSSSYPFYSPLSSTEGWTCLTSLLLRRPLHSERFWGSAVSIPSFFLSSNNTSSHDFLGLPDLFCATMFSLRTWAIQPLLRSTCPYHLILLERSTTSISWSPSFDSLG